MTYKIKILPAPKPKLYTQDLFVGQGVSLVLPQDASKYRSHSSGPGKLRDMSITGGNRIIGYGKTPGVIHIHFQDPKTGFDAYRVDLNISVKTQDLTLYKTETKRFSVHSEDTVNYSNGYIATIKR